MIQQIMVEAHRGILLERLGLMFRVRNQMGSWRLTRYETRDGCLTKIHGYLALETGDRRYGSFPAEDIHDDDLMRLLDDQAQRRPGRPMRTPGDQPGALRDVGFGRMGLADTYRYWACVTCGAMYPARPMQGSSSSSKSCLLLPSVVFYLGLTDCPRVAILPRVPPTATAEHGSDRQIESRRELPGDGKRSWSGCQTSELCSGATCEEARIGVVMNDLVSSNGPTCNGRSIARCPWCREDSEPWKDGRGR